MPRLHFEDFTPGDSRIYGPLEVSRDDIVGFARQFDPQPFHVDETAAKATFVGTLIASGWHSCAINMRLIADGFLLDSAGMGAPGIEEVKWLRPVLPGDLIRSRATVLESRISKSKPDRGLIRFRFELLNAADEAVLVQTNWIMFARRDAGEAQNGTSRGEAEAKGSPSPSAPTGTVNPNPYLDDLVRGQGEDLGAFTFTAEAIIDFATRFDPQPFHVDQEAARRSHFGALCASGWHTAAVWMKQMVTNRIVRASEAVLRGERPAMLGPSPGFKNLKWRKPVYAGDTVTYRSAILRTRPSATRPDWGIAFHRNTGLNQHGEEVFSFEGAVFWERRIG
jgi:acyl dehydratase